MLSSWTKLVQTSNDIVIYTETEDIVLDVKTFARPTLPTGACKCLHHYHGHHELLWHLGSGKMIAYQYLHVVIHQFVLGLPMNAGFESRRMSMSSVGVNSSLTYNEFGKTCLGYANMLQFHKDDFICENCGPTPEYIVADGKMCGPTKRKVALLSEFDRADGDESALVQGSDFNSRVFLPRRPERKAVCELLTNSITQEEFLQSDELQSQNSQMLKNLIE